MSGSYSYEMELRPCENCGGWYRGGQKSHYCPDCRRLMKAGRDRELADEKTGWRNMLRDDTGTVIVPGGNVMSCLDALCSYEEACQALGVEGPEQLHNLLSHVATLMPQEVILRCAKEGRRPEPRKREASSAVRIEYGCRCCGSCGHFVPERETGKGTAGHCAIHPRKIRSGGGKKGRLVEVPGEHRKCFGAREACKDWARREDADPSTASRRSPCVGLPVASAELPQRRENTEQSPGLFCPASRGGFDGGELAHGAPVCAATEGGRPMTAPTEGGRPMTATTEGGRPMTAQTEGGELNAG